MPPIVPSEVPEASLLHRYAALGYVDCYVTTTPGLISHSMFVQAFYTTPLFRVERVLLRWFASKPSTDEDVFALTSGTADAFAAWRVEARTVDQILLADFSGRTRSWLMVATNPTAPSPTTFLYFGSAVVLLIDPRTGKKRMGIGFAALLGFHRLYSRLLLRAAARRIAK